MSKIINIKIDLMKIDKNKLYHAESGAKYLDATVFLSDEPDKFGQYGMITQDVTKDEREAGEKGAILGNVRRIFDKDAPKPKQKRNGPEQDDNPDSLPF